MTRSNTTGAWWNSIRTTPRLAIRIGQICATKRDVTNAVRVLEAWPLQPTRTMASWPTGSGSSIAPTTRTTKPRRRFVQALKSEPSNVNALGGLLEILILQDGEKEAIKIARSRVPREDRGGQLLVAAGRLSIRSCSAKTVVGAEDRPKANPAVLREGARLRPG
jgi:hypothetical protein